VVTASPDGARVRVVADSERCVGAGQCVLTAPSVFDQRDDDGTVLLRTDRLAGAAVAVAHRAVDRCPARALSLRPE
jgi:ferredoxin